METLQNKYRILGGSGNNLIISYLKFIKKFGNLLAINSMLIFGSFFITFSILNGQIQYVVGTSYTTPDWWNGNCSVELADVDLDGDIDMMAGFLYLNDGNGNFTKDNDIEYYRGSFADPDGDGDQDWFCHAYGPTGIYQNDGAGNFSLWKPLPTGSIGYKHHPWGDLDGDGDDDFVNNDAYNNYVWISNGDGTFTKTQTISVPGWAQSAGLGDLDNDGDLDLITRSGFNKIRVWENDGAGTFSGPVYSWTSVYNYHNPKVDDINNDGNADIVCYVGGYGNFNGEIFFGQNGNFEFDDPVYTEYLGGYYDGVGGRFDVDLDGDLDFLSGSRWRLNDGTGIGIQGNLPIPSPNPWIGSPGAGDFDLDGDLDVMVTTRTYINGAYHFTPISYFMEGLILNSDPDCSNASIPIHDADDTCGATISGDDVTGITDIDGDDLTITVSPTNLVLGQNTVTVIADDGNGGSCTIDIDVEVVDTTPPIAICNDITVQLDSMGNASITENDINNGSSDACAIESVVLDETTFDCSDLNVSGGDQFTVEAWINPSTTSGGWHSFLAKDHWNANDGFVFYISGGNVYFGRAGWAFPHANHRIGAPISANIWTHIAGIYDQGIWLMYVNGSLVGSFNSPGLTNSNTPFVIANRNHNNGATAPVGYNNYPGKIDEVRIWDIARTETQILGSMNNTLIGNEAGLVGYYPFEDGPGSNTVSDLSGFNNTASLLNMDPATDWVAGNPTLGTGSLFALDFDDVNDQIVLGNQTQYDFSGQGITLSTVTLTVTDANGNSSFCEATVTVEDNIPPVPDIDPLEEITGECSVTVTAPTATDNCAGALTATTADLLTYDTQGSYTVTWTYDDGNENTYTQTQTVIVDDVTPPVPDIDPLEEITGECSVTVTAPTATDNCAGALTATTADLLTYDTQGSYTVTWTYDDGNENTYTQTQTVIVDDVTPPVITVECPVSIELCGDQTVTWIEPQATDNCPGMTTSSTHTPGDMFTFGTTTVTYTFTDVGNNVSECSFDITIRALPDVNITQNTVPDFCQGLMLLEAEVNNTDDLLMPLEYTWAGLPDDDFDAIVTTNGTYDLTVEDGYNCATTVTTVVDEVPSDAVSAYVLIASKELHAEETTVTGGGIGVMEAGKKAKVKKNSVINGFTKADVIDKDATSTIDTEILGQVDVTLPPFYLDDDNCDGDDITVDKDETMTLDGEVYGKIKVKENGTLIFDSPELYIEDLDTKKDATIVFLQSSNVMVKKEIKIDKDNQVNANGYSVTFYVEKHVDIKEGTIFNANIFAEKDIKVDGKANNFSIMTGLFISLEKIHSKNYVDWFASDVCDSAPIPDGASCNSALISSSWTVDTELLVYPNPTSGMFNIELYADKEAEVKVVVIDMMGSVKLVKESSLYRGENIVDVDISQLNSGVYFIKVVGNNTELTTPIILIR